MPKPVPAVERKVLLRPDFGLCALLPKTHWDACCPAGESRTLLVDGRAMALTVASEACDCQGTGLHEHRFLCFAPDAGVRPGQRVVVQFESAEDVVPRPTVSAAIDEINDAALFGKPLSVSRRRELGRFLGHQQGIPGSYGGLIGPVGDEIAGGYCVFTGDRVRTGAAARHILGEEGLRALILLQRPAPVDKGSTLASAAIERAMASMDECLAGHEREGRNVRGRYCCNQCSVALWRALAVGAYAEPADRLACGLRDLATRRDGKGGWLGFPTSYVVAVLAEAQVEEALAELRYARGAVEKRLAARPRVGEPYASRRRRICELALERVG